jgi:anti-anti-sigma regulatory factor
MNVEGCHMEVRVRPSGVLDGARAMELLNELARFRAWDVLVDFSGVRQFEPFGADVLVEGLRGLHKGGTRLRCLGLPPCLAERVREEEIVVGEASGHPRWAPWSP